jgi:hypothetical protein
MRKIAAVLFLVLAAAAVWVGVRWLAGRDQVKVTIVFRDAQGLRRGDPAVLNHVNVGRVSSVDRLDDRDAVTVRLDREQRRSVVSDSLFSIEDHSLVIMNAFAVGAPVENGAVLQAREDKLSRWLAKNGSKVEPYVEQLKKKTDEGVDAARAKVNAKTTKEETDKLKQKAQELFDKVRK